MLRKLLRGAEALPADDHGPAESPGGVWQQAGGFLWLAAFLLLLWLAGFLLATIIFIFAFTRLSGQRTFKQAALVAAAATAFEYVVFVWLLEYRLYAGVLFAN